MFQKSKYNKASQGAQNYRPNLNISLQPSKYNTNIYSKKKQTIKKKLNNNKFSQNNKWKKQTVYNNWNKENINYDQQYTNIKSESNQNYYVPKEKKKTKPFYNKEYSQLYSYNNTEYVYENKNSEKNEKKISIDYATTQSNSSSHEDTINNNINKNSNLTINNDLLNVKIEDENKNIVKYNNNTVTDFQNLNLNSNLLNNLNQGSNKQKPKSRKNSNKENNSNMAIQPRKNSNIKYSLSSKDLDIKKCISGKIENNVGANNEPYNKFNSMNNELINPSINPFIENTEILQVNVKISKDKYVLFKLRRFDDLFLTVKLFCEINSIEERLIKPIITKALCTLNSIYQIYNTQLDSNNIKILQMIKNFEGENYI